MYQWGIFIVRKQKSRWRVERCTEVNGEAANGMVMVSTPGPTVSDMRVTSAMVELTDTASALPRTEILMRGSGIKTVHMDTASMYTLTEAPMKENGIRMKNLEKVSSADGARYEGEFLHGSKHG